VDVYLEQGAKRVFAVAVEWPGWARAGRTQEDALTALLGYADRYRAAIGAVAGAPDAPQSKADLQVVERLAGNATTDFGAPGVVPKLDRAPLAAQELQRLIEIHAACWAFFEHAAHSAKGRRLAPAGPRGGGRSLAKIRAHVAEAETAYVRATGGRTDFEATLRARAAGELPDRGPRGGIRWPARYAVRRSCWHLLDHGWEIEDRLSG
jgi:hypothetical protein